MFDQYTDIGVSVVNSEPIVRADPPAPAWNYKKQGSPDDWTMKTCDATSAAKMAMSPIDVDTTYTNPGTGSPHDCMHAKCYYDWTQYSGSFIPHYS